MTASREANADTKTSLFISRGYSIALSTILNMRVPTSKRRPVLSTALAIRGRCVSFGWNRPALYIIYKVWTIARSNGRIRSLLSALAIMFTNAVSIVFWPQRPRYYIASIGYIRIYRRPIS